MSSDQRNPSGDAVGDGEPTRLATGELLDNYKILRLLGRGPMSEVYLARDQKLGRKVALKLMSKHLMQSRPAFDQFIREAEALAQLSHPHIVTLYGVGEHKDEPFIALEYVEGETMRQRTRGDGGSVRDTERLALAIASAMREAHARDIIHGDLKPENIVISRDGRLRVLDFGLAKFFSRWQDPAPALPADVPAVLDERDTISTQVFDENDELEKAGQDATFGFGSGMDTNVQGTPAYMAPEQWHMHKRTPAVDVWAFGVIVYELLTGRRPYEAENMFELAKVVGAKTQAPQLQATVELPERFAALINRCLSKNPVDRPTASEAQRILEQLVYGASMPQMDQDSPFRGLQAFTEDEAGLFFGRDDEIAMFVERLRDEVVLPIVGASGVGKSSFVQAGVIPRLRERGPYDLVRFRPGAAPFSALAARLLSERTNPHTLVGVPRKQVASIHQLAQDLYDNPKSLALLLQERAQEQKATVLLLVDQLEEVCTLVPDAETRLRFLQAICSAADDVSDPVRVLFTCRDDFLTRLAESAEARVALSRVMVLRAPGDEALREILTRSLRVVGYDYDDPTLVETMMQAVAKETSALPLLQFAGTLLWDRRDQVNKKLLRSSYDDIGGIQGALATHAAAFMQGMDDRQTQIVRSTMLRLVTPEGTRRVTAIVELTQALGPESEGITQGLINARLLSVRHILEEAHVELSHESLVHTWDRLAAWLQEGREELLFLSQLDQAAALWDGRGRKRSEVWTGAALAEAVRNLDRYGSRLPSVPAAFMTASKEADRRRLRQRQLLKVAAVATLVIIALVSAVTAVRFSEKTQIALTRQAQAQVEGARSAFVRGEYIEAQAQLRSSLETRDSPMARALWGRMSHDPEIWHKRLPNVIIDAVWSPDGETVAAGSIDGSIYLVDRATADITVLRNMRQQIYGVAFSPDGKTLVACDVGGNVGRWNLGTDEFKTSAPHRFGECRAAFSPDGQRFAVASFDGGIALLRPDLTVERTLEPGGGQVYQARFSADGAWLVSAHADGQTRLWDVQTGAVKRIFSLDAKAIYSALLTPDGNTLIAGGADGWLTAWSTKSAEKLWRVQAHQAAVVNMRWLPGNDALLSASFEPIIKAFSLKDGAAKGTWSRHDSAAPSIDVNRAGEVLSAGTTDRTLRVWNLQRVGAEDVHHGHDSAVQRVRISNDGRSVISASEDRTIKYWDLATGAEQYALVGHKDLVNALALSANGKWLASGAFDNDIILWDVAKRQQKRLLSGHASAIYDLAFIDGDRRLLSVSNDQTVRIWDTEAGTEVKRWETDGALFGAAITSKGELIAASYESHFVWKNLNEPPEKRPQAGWGVDIAPDGKTYLLASLGGEVRILDRAGKIVREFERPADATAGWSHFDPSGKRIAVSFNNGIARLYSVDTGKWVELRGHAAAVIEVIFDPSGNYAISVSDDGTVRAWDARTGEPHWRGVTLSDASGEILTHEGWRRVAEPKRAGFAQTSWHRAVSRAREADESGDVLCVSAGGALELWEVAADRLVAKAMIPGLRSLRATPTGCLALADGAVHAMDNTGATRVIDQAARAFSFEQGVLFVIKDEAVSFGPLGGAMRKIDVPFGVTSAALLQGRLALGFANGTMELVDLNGDDALGGRRKTSRIENQPGSLLSRIVEGPEATMILGYSNGNIGVWNQRDGAQLSRIKLHGPPLKIAVRGSRVDVLTELGDFGSIDLSSLVADYCALLGDLAREVPVVWREGRPVRAAAAPDRGCDTSH